jgi:hypothetical protein
MSASPLFLKLQETRGMPYPNSIFDTNFGWYFLKNQLKGGILNVL